MLTAQQKLEILCAYLPHGVECEVDGKVAIMHSVYSDGSCTFYDLVEAQQGFQSIRPILRHPDDITEDEVLNLVHVITGINNTVIVDAINCLCLRGYISNIDEAAELTLLQSIKCLRYLHSIHVDTFGAIEAGWAIRKEVSNG